MSLHWMNVLIFPFDTSRVNLSSLLLTEVGLIIAFDLHFLTLRSRITGSKTCHFIIVPITLFTSEKV